MKPADENAQVPLSKRVAETRKLLYGDPQGEREQAREMRAELRGEDADPETEARTSRVSRALDPRAVDARTQLKADGVRGQWRMQGLIP